MTNSSNIDSVVSSVYINPTISPMVTVTPRKAELVSRGEVNRIMDEKLITEPVVKVDNDKDKVDFKYIDSFVADVTAYTLHPSECGFKYPGDVGYGITASGKYVVEGITIAASSKYKFGTKIRLDGFKSTFTILDRGGDIKNNRIDVFMNNRTQAFNFGRKKLKAYIIEYGTGKVK